MHKRTIKEERSKQHDNFQFVEMTDRKLSRNIMFQAQKGHTGMCPVMIRSAVEILDELIEEHKQ